MSGPNFFQTRMGQNFYEGTAPQIADSLNRIANQLEENAKGVSFELDSNEYPMKLKGFSTADPQYPGLVIELEKNGGVRPVVRVEHNDALGKIFVYIWENADEDFSQKITIKL